MIAINNDHRGAANRGSAPIAASRVPEVRASPIPGSAPLAVVLARVGDRRLLDAVVETWLDAEPTGEATPAPSRSAYGRQR